MNIVEINWMASVDQDEVHEAMQEATIDCYDESEQWMGLTTMAAESLAFPFAAKVLGEPVEVIDSASSQHDGFGFERVVGHKGKTTRLPHAALN